MRLPNGHKADLGRKLEDYILNPDHREGRHKARVFASTLGLTREDVEVLQTAILESAKISDEVAWKGDNGFGNLYELRFPLQTKIGSAIILTAWLVRHGEDFPRLVTCYIL